jgi:hypothetical protein
MVEMPVQQDDLHGVASSIPYPLKHMGVRQKTEIHCCPVMTVQRRKAIMLIHGVPVYGLGVSHNAGFGVPAK